MRLCSILYIMLSILVFLLVLRVSHWRIFKKLGYCSWLSRIVLCAKSGSLSLEFFLRYIQCIGLTRVV